MQLVGAYLIVQDTNSRFKAYHLESEWSAEAAHESDLAEAIAEHARAGNAPGR
jgi:hypothetical protein